MKKLVLLAMMMLFVVTAALAVPQYINYQGILRDIPGNLQNGTFTMSFKIFNADTGGIAVFDSGSQSITVSNGLYNVRLGPVNATPIFDGPDKWLEVAVSGVTLSPRLRINSVAYAIRADVAGSAASADYATTSGSANTATFATTSANATNAATATYATTAGDATTVDSYHANATATAGNLLPLDANRLLTGMSISAFPTVSNGFAAFINGKLGASGCVGTGSVPTGTGGVTITNSAFTTSSIVLITVGTASTPEPQPSKALRISAVDPGPPVTFTIKTVDGNNDTAHAIPFSYLIIN